MQDSSVGKQGSIFPFLGSEEEEEEEEEADLIIDLDWPNGKINPCLFRPHYANCCTIVIN